MSIKAWKPLKQLLQGFLCFYFLTASLFHPVRAAAKSLVQGIDVFINIESVSDANLQRAIGEASSMGFKRLRAVMSWAVVEPEPNRFKFEVYDRLVELARKNGIKLMFSLSYSPPWAAGDPNEDPADARMRMMPNNLRDWQRFVAAAVSRYKNDVTEWQIWEHPSIENFRGTSEDYGKLLSSAHAAAKKADPQAILITAEPGGPDLGFVAKLFRKSTVHSFDGIALSPELYSPDQIAEYLIALRGIIAAHPDSPKRIYLNADYAAVPEPPQQPQIAGPVCLDFALDRDLEQGLYVHRYRQKKMADPLTTLQRGVPSAELTDENPFLYFDVDDRYIFFNQGVHPISITVRADVRGNQPAGFNLMYDSPQGYVFSRWTWIKPSGQNDYTIILPNANFANKGGFDFRLSALGSRQSVYVSEVCVVK